MKHWIALGLLAAGSAAGQTRLGDCEDAYVECKEDCLIRWGGTTDLKKRAKNNQCINKCESVDRDCREAIIETSKGNLDEGALTGSPSSRDVDSDGLPTKTAQKKPPPPPKQRDDDARDDAPPPKKDEKPVQQKPELAAEETPKSTRSSLKTDPKDKPAEPAPKKEEKPTATEKKREEPPPRREEPKPAPPPEDAPPPKKEKKEEKREEPKKDRKALDEWDPDAL